MRMHQYGWRTGLVVAAIIVSLTFSVVIPLRTTAPSNQSSASDSSSLGAGLPPTTSSSPHPGTLEVYEVAPGGATTEDPSVAYDTVSEEPVYNVYQTLIQYNGSSTSSFLPVLSLCVPGPGCGALYGGNTLIVNNKITGSPEYFTFPIDAAARFYDPSTGSNWSVYPSDVAFSIARTCGFADLPGVGATPGWMPCQALLPIGNPTWDGAIHSPYNNTPQSVLSSMLINDSKYCPAAALAENGCVTFNAGGSDTDWPFFLQLLADPMGGSVEPCGWFTYQNAGVPGFAGTTAHSGDGPCLLPGDATSTSNASFKSWLHHTPATYWDSFEELAFHYPAIQPGVRWNMTGSGPYYLADQPLSPTAGYTLKQNPAYHQPTGCPGVNCEPLPGPTHYVAKVVVHYEVSDAVGIKKYEAGTADAATILSGETATLLKLQAEGKVNATVTPTLTEWFLPFALEFSLPAAKALDPNPINVPDDFFNYVGLREFLVNAFPYDTVEKKVFTIDGIPYGSNYGGVIPRHMGNYYPTNISWPSGNPVSNSTIVGSAGWWWTQATSPTSPYYDPELVSCTTSSPCEFPIIGENNSTTVNQPIQDYLPYISSISGGRLAPNTFNVSFFTLVVNGTTAPPGQSPLPFFNLGWAPDYPDPTDYVTPMYLPNSTYTSSDAVEQGLSQYTCANDNGGPPDWASMSGLLYWADQATGIPQACQGNAYAAMEYGMYTAATMVVGPARVLMYNLVEHIANHLALYVYSDQANAVISYAPWIQSSSVNVNPIIGAYGDQTWYLWS